MGRTPGGVGTEPRESSILWTVPGEVPQHVASIATSAVICPVADLSSELVDGGVKAGYLIALLHGGCLWHQEALSLQTLVLSFQSTNGGFPAHGSSILIHFVMDLDCLKVEGQDIAVQEGGCSKNNEVGWCGSSAQDTTA